MMRGLILALVIVVYATSPMLAEEPDSPPSKAPAVPKQTDPEIEKKFNELMKIRREEMEKERDQAGSGKIDGDQVRESVPEKELYYKCIRDIITSNWVIPKEYLSEHFRCMVQIIINPDGTIINTRITQSSGFDDLDQAILQAVKKSAPLPPLPLVFNRQALSIALNFTPGLVPIRHRAQGKNNTETKNAE